MRITLITPCYNEEKVLPFFLDYYTTVCDEIVIFDGNSIDTSQAIVRSYIGRGSCNVELRINHSVGTVDGYTPDILKALNNDHARSLHFIRNNAFKYLFSRDLNDWIVIADCDEFLYHPRGLRARLEELRQAGVTLPQTRAYDMVSEIFPAYPGSIFEQVPRGNYNKFYSKSCVFDSRKIRDMQYWPGCHQHEADGLVKRDDGADPLLILHYCFLGFEEWRKAALCKQAHRSDINKEHQWGVHYETLLKTTTSFQDFLARSKQIL